MRNLFFVFDNFIVATEELAETEVKVTFGCCVLFLILKTLQEESNQIWLNFLFDWCFFLFCPGHNSGLQKEYEYWDPPSAF